MTVQVSQVAGTHPPVVGKGGTRGLGVLVVTQHHVLPLDKNLTYALVVGIVNLDFHIQHRFAA